MILISKLYKQFNNNFSRQIIVTPGGNGGTKLAKHVYNSESIVAGRNLDSDMPNILTYRLVQAEIALHAIERSLMPLNRNSLLQCRTEDDEVSIRRHAFLSPCFVNKLIHARYQFSTP